MKKEIKVIDLLNISANREPLPKKIKYQGRIYVLYEAYGGYFVENHFGEDKFRFLGNKNVQYYAVLNNHVEIVENILDDKEKEYLSNVIRPFRDKVKFIQKYSFESSSFIRIEYKDILGDYYDISFPSFKPNTMYKNMDPDKKYSLEELGL